MRKVRAEQIFLLDFGPRRALKKEQLLFCPGGRFPATILSAPFNWNDDPFTDNNWVAQIQMWRPLDWHILAYERSQDEGWLEEPRKLILDWHEYYQTREPAYYVWADMNVGIRAMKIAWFLDLHNSGQCPQAPGFIDACKKMRESHLRFLRNGEKDRHSNHDLMDLHGAMALAQTLPENEGLELAAFIERRLDWLLGEQFFEDGVHRENSPQYQEFTVHYLKRMLNTGWFGNTRLPFYAQRASETLPWFIMPDGRLASVGDTNYEAPEACKRKPVSASRETEFFNSSGYVVHKPEKLPEQTNGSYLFFMCARHSLTHKHSDDLSIYWYEDEDILIDPGKYSYQPGQARKFMLSTRAHNTLEIDGCDEYSRGRPMRPVAPLPMVDAAAKGTGMFMAVANMLVPEFSACHERVLYHMPNKWLVVCDRVFSTRPHRYRFHWHFPPGFDFDFAAGTGVGALASGRRLHFAFQSSEKYSPFILCGQTEPEMQGFCSQGYGELLPAPCLALESTLAEWRCAMAFALDEPLALSRLQVGRYIAKQGTERWCFRPWQAVPPAGF